MVLRSQNVVKKYGNISDERISKLLKELNIGSDLLTSWKKNLGKIVNCRSIDEVMHHPDVNDLFKAIALRDAFGVAGRFLVFVDRRGPEDFVLSDACPLTHNIEDDEGNKFPLFLCLPISPSRMMISVIHGIEFANKSISMFDKSFFTKPFISNDGKKLSFSIRKMYEKDVIEFNDGMFKSAKEGVAYYSEERFFAVDRNK